MTTVSLIPIRRALLSVSDKAGLVELAAALTAAGAELVSTGGTARALREAGLEVTDVTTVTGFPEILDGRVKTLHPAVHAGLLARGDDPDHDAALAAHRIARFDLVVASLYPFEAALARGADADEQIEEIDVGGPAMIRAAAKNHGRVAVTVDPADYGLIHDALAAGGTDLALRRRLAAKAFSRTAAYDAAIAGWLAGVTGELLPEHLTVTGRRRQLLRYGENPHQRAAFYATAPARAGLATARQLQGKELSYNNILDADAALGIVMDLAQPAVAIVKHANPCGVAIGTDLVSAWRKALACDPVSAFGGIVAVNRPLDAAAATAMAELFLEVVIAPAITANGMAALAGKTGLRLLEAGPEGAAPAPELRVRSVTGGLLVQEADVGGIDLDRIEVATTRPPTAAERADLLLAWTVVRHVASNAIVLVRDGATVGIGMGQSNRVDSVWLAAKRMAAGPGAGPCVVASDAFFPFADGLIAAAEAGATAVIQPGGSVRDAEVIAAADAHGMAMVLTRMRHFRH